MVESNLIEFRRYKVVIEKAIAQVSEEALNRIPFPEGNSIAMIVRHLSGNLVSRFTGFLSTDGEKPWRNREQEFLEGSFTRKELDQNWKKAWLVLEEELSELKESDMEKTVVIRGINLLAREAINRSMAHIAYHAGQVVLLARMYRDVEWQWISIPKGGSDEYNQKPYLEKAPSK